MPRSRKPKRKQGAAKRYPKLTAVDVVAKNTLMRKHLTDGCLNETSASMSVQDCSVSGSVASVSEILDNLTVLSTSDDSTGEVTKSETRRRVANVGKDWNHFKPHDSTSLYQLVLCEVDFAKDWAFRWLKLWEEHPVDATAFMLQLVLDVAGYQDYNIMEIYNTGRFTEKIILKELEDNCPLLLLDYTYLLNTTSAWGNTAKERVYEFLNEIIIYCNKEQRHNYSMLNDLLKFIKILSRSEVRALKHTSVVFAIRLLVPLSKLQAKCKEELKRYAANKDVATIEIANVKCLQKREDTLRKFLVCLYSVISNNYTFQESDLKDMRKECLNGLYKALHHNPEFFFKASQDPIDIFTDLLPDTNSEVCLLSIELIKKIVESKKLYPYFKRKVSDVFPQIFTCRLSVDYSVAIAAVDVFTASLDLYARDIPKTFFNAIFIMVYNKHYPLAKAAGRFLRTYICQAHNNEIAILKQIVRFSKMPNVEHLLPLLVEALMDCAPELRSYDSIIELLLTNEEAHEEDSRLLQILCHSIMQTITGEASIHRIKHRQEIAENIDVVEIMDPILNNFVDLFKKFYEDADCAKALLEMLLSFSYQDALIVKYRTNILHIAKVLSRYFLVADDPKMLDMISRLLLKICDDRCPLRVHGLSILRNTAKECENTYKQVIDDENMWEECDIALFEKVMLQLQYLFKYHNISTTWEVDKIPNLFSRGTISNENLLSSNLLCVFYYHKRMFENGLQQFLLERTAQALDELKQKRDTFLELCYEQIRCDTSKIITKTAYECICDFSIIISDEIYKEINPDILSLKTMRLSSEQKDILLKFFNKYIFDDRVPEPEGVKLLGKFCDCIMKSAMPTYLLPDIFVHYNTFYDKYGELFDHILKNITQIDASVTGVVVSTTLILEFQKLRNKSTRDTGEETHIKKLALQFGKFLTKKPLVVTLQYAIKFALEEEENLRFLHYLNDYCQKLPQDSRSLILDYIMNIKNYDTFQGNKYVVKFQNILQSNKKVKTDRTQDRSRRRPSTTSMESETSSHLYEASTEAIEDPDN